MRARCPAVLTLVAALLCGCREPNRFQAPPPPTVTVTQPIARTITPSFAAVGRTQARVAVEIRARVQGFLKSIEFEEGIFVDEGDLLFTIEEDEYQAALRAAEANEAQARALANQTAAELERIRGLVQVQAASEKEIIDAEAASESAAAALLAAEARTVQARLDLDYTQIHAPTSGKTNRAAVDVGNLVGQGEPTLLTTIVTWDPIEVYFDASERNVLEFRRRQAGEQDLPDNLEVFLELIDGTRYPQSGRIDYADNRIDPGTGTMRVRAIFDNPELLLVPGLFVRVRIPRDPIETLLVPETCVQRDLAGHFVLAVDAQNAVQRIDVQPGEASDGMRAIQSGLEGDERIIVRGLQRVRPGLTVEVETAAATSQPTSAPAADDA